MSIPAFLKTCTGRANRFHQYRLILVISPASHLSRHPPQNESETGKENTPSISVLRENAIPFFNFTSAADLCGKNEEITMARMYEIELQRDALFV